MTVDNPYRKDLAIITNGGAKLNLSSILGISALSLRNVSDAISLGEQSVDEKLGVNLTALDPTYNTKVVIGKANSALEIMQRWQDPNKRFPGRFGVTDSTWIIGVPGSEIRMNKPSAAKEGSITGVRETLELFNKNRGKPIGNETALAVFSLNKGIEKIYRWEIALGRINPDFDLDRFKEICFSGRHNNSAGLNFEDGLQAEVILPTEGFINVAMTSYEPKGGEMQNGSIVSWDHLRYNLSLPYEKLNKDQELTRLSYFVLGIFPPDFDFSTFLIEN